MIINKDNLSEGEIQLIKWQHRQQGSFYTALWSAIKMADDGNLERLEKAFPEDVKTYKRFAHESGYYNDVCRRAGIDQWTGAQL